MLSVHVLEYGLRVDDGLDEVRVRHLRVSQGGLRRGLGVVADVLEHVARGMGRDYVGEVVDRCATVEIQLESGVNR